MNPDCLSSCSPLYCPLATADFQSLRWHKRYKYSGDDGELIGGTAFTLSVAHVADSGIEFIAWRRVVLCCGADCGYLVDNPGQTSAVRQLLFNRCSPAGWRFAIAMKHNIDCVV